jgi:hypothetical protein
MTAPGNSAVLFVLLAAFLTCTGYAAGRLHQWHRTGQERDEAYRDGYDTATRSVFSMAARIIGPRRSERATIRASAAVPQVSPVPPGSPVSPVDAQVLGLPSTSSGRHTVADELVHPATYRLTSDRVARAKARGSAPPRRNERPSTPVPKPRSS